MDTPKSPDGANKVKAAIAILSGLVCVVVPLAMPLKAEVIPLSALQCMLRSDSNP